MKLNYLFAIDKSQVVSQNRQDSNENVSVYLRVGKEIVYESLFVPLIISPHLASAILKGFS